MKKIIALVSLLVLVLSLSACGGKFTCDGCGQESRGGHKVEYAGQKAKLCDDCYKIWEAASSLGAF